MGADPDTPGLALGTQAGTCIESAAMPRQICGLSPFTHVGL